MKQYLILVIIGLLPTMTFAQQDSTEKTIDPPRIVETMPEFPGGQQEITRFIVKHVEYPEASRKNESQGRVYVSFVVDKDGSVIDPVILRGVDSLIDAEAIRVIKLMPKWKPGTQRGKPVKVKFTLPINFRLD